MIQRREVLQIHAWIDSLPKEKAIQTAVEFKVHQGQAAIKNGAIVDANSSVVDRAAFNVKAKIEEALKHLSDLESEA